MNHGAENKLTLVKRSMEIHVTFKGTYFRHLPLTANIWSPKQLIGLMTIYL